MYLCFYLQENGGNNFWIPRPVADSWIQVDLGLPRPAVTGLIAQGETTKYVSTFSVKYSDDAESWTDLKDADGDTIQVRNTILLNSVAESIGLLNITIEV